MAKIDLDPTRQRFTFHGPIRILDLAERRLSLGGRNLWLAPDVPTGDLELGTELVAKGYEAEAGERWVVDLITITSVSLEESRARRAILRRSSEKRGLQSGR